MAETKLASICTSSNSRPCTHRTRSGDVTAAQDVETGSPVICRICLENDGGELISPCLCKGTQQFVHRQCLDHWRSVREGFAFAHCTTCNAQFKFQILDFKNDILTRIKHKLFVIKDVFLQFLIVQLFIALIGCYLYIMDFEKILLNSMDENTELLIESRISFYYSTGAFALLVFYGGYFAVPDCLTLRSNICLATIQNCCVLFYYMEWIPMPIMILCFGLVCVLFGLAYGLLAASLAIQRSWHRNYQLLTKRNLTKVYVVVDQQGVYVPPELDHVQQEFLRELHLL